jgi:L-alanine-DL-glutamate epimerase-like enolase superfamily enzyme
MTSRFRIDALLAEPLSVPLIEPFVIASGKVDVTPSVLVTVRLRDLESGRSVEGFGEAATLPPVTNETQKDVLFHVLDRASKLRGVELESDSFDALTVLLDLYFSHTPVARCGVETAVLDAWARLTNQPLHALLGSARATQITTDITIPIAEPEHMGALAERWWERGFRHFKVKVGRGVDTDLEALEAIHARTPEASIRLDANAGYSAAEAIAIVNAAEEIGLRVECFEQPCGRLAHAAMAEVAATIQAPVIADESVTTIDELHQVIAAKAARGVNLKLTKMGGPLKALAIGQAARAAGLQLMVGAMVETRLGISAAAHVATALGGAEIPDLDTALLLAEDPFAGGYEADGPRLTLSTAPGLAIERR